MIGIAFAEVPSFPVVLSSSSVSLQCKSGNCLPFTFRQKGKQLRVRATLSDTGSSEGKNPIAVVLDFPRSLWRQMERPLRDFGFGHRSIWEGGVGLFLVSGAVLFALSIAWLKGFQLRAKYRKYLTVFEFAQACGLCTGTQVRIRGVTVGNVIRVNPSLKSIEAVVEVEDDKIIIPRNSLVEVNQSGLLMETVIDITPRDPIPTPTFGPLHPECFKEGLIVCNRHKMKGDQGVSLDEMVGIFTRLGQEVEQIGIANTYLLAERVSSVIEEAKPLLMKIQAMAEDVQPLLAEIHSNGLLNEVESLTKSLTQASDDLRFVPMPFVHVSNLNKNSWYLGYTMSGMGEIFDDANLPSF